MTPADFEKELETIANKMVTLAEESPDFVYEGRCQYAKSTKNPQGCLVGAAVRGTKLSLDTYPHQGAAASAALRIKAKVDYADLSDGGATLLEEICRTQRIQDKKRSWGEAIEPLKDYLLETGQLSV